MRYTSPRAEKWSRDLKTLHERRVHLERFLELAGLAKDEIAEILRELEDEEASIPPDELEELAEDILEAATDLRQHLGQAGVLEALGCGAEVVKAITHLESQLEKERMRTLPGFQEAVEKVRGCVSAEKENGQRILDDISRSMSKLREKIRQRVDCAGLLKKEQEKLDLELAERRIALGEKSAAAKVEVEPEPVREAAGEDRVGNVVEAHAQLYETYARERRKIENAIVGLSTKYSHEQREERRTEHRRLEGQLKDLEARFKDDEKALQRRFRNDRDTRPAESAKKAVRHSVADQMLALEAEFQAKKREIEEAFRACQNYRKELLDIDESPPDTTAK